MSKTNGTKLGPATQVRELRADELENVSGGAIIAADFAFVEYLDTTLRSSVPALLKESAPSVGGRGICPFPDVC
jgi:hypothetical protein